MRPAAPRAVNEAPARAQMLSPAASSAPPAMKIASFPDLVALAAERRDLQTKAALEADVRLVRFEDGRLEVAMERSAARTLINDLARKLEQWRDRGTREVRFVIGAADGHSDEERGRADLLLSFGPTTWPHLLVRAMLAEQLFRATSILANHPYHREG